MDSRFSAIRLELENRLVVLLLNEQVWGTPKRNCINADFPTLGIGRRLILAIWAWIARETKLTQVSFSKKSASLQRIEDVNLS
jgi:hypothetical protein